MNKELAIECIKTQRQFVDDMTREAFDMAIDLIKEAKPSVDVAPVRHGRWKTYKTEVAGRGFFYCTKCRADAYDATNYCPICGAKMDEEK